MVRYVAIEFDTGYQPDQSIALTILFDFPASG
jgi:hypothetical protein